MTSSTQEKRGRVRQYDNGSQRETRLEKDRTKTDVEDTKAGMEGDETRIFSQDGDVEDTGRQSELYSDRFLIRQ